MRVKVGVDSRTNSYARFEMFCLAEIPLVQVLESTTLEFGFHSLKE